VYRASRPLPKMGARNSALLGGTRRSRDADPDGEDVRPHPWETRRAILTGLLRRASPGILLSAHIDDADGATVGSWLGCACVQILPSALDIHSPPFKCWLAVKT
jgi:hypothetical protein